MRRIFEKYDGEVWVRMIWFTTSAGKDSSNTAMKLNVHKM
jgi:hypothetical protein